MWYKNFDERIVYLISNGLFVKLRRFIKRIYAVSDNNG